LQFQTDRRIVTDRDKWESAGRRSLWGAGGGPGRWAATVGLPKRNRYTASVPMNEGFTYREQIDLRADGALLRDHLVQRYPHSSAAEWDDRIASGRILLDGAVAAPGATLRRGQVLTWNRPPWDEPASPGAFQVLYDDGDLLAVEKPAGLPTLPGAGFHRSCLLVLVREIAGDAAPVHRLGRFTSGVVLFARTPASRASLARQWRSREVRRVYRGIASGAPERDAFAVATPIGPIPHPLLGSVHAAHPGGKPARSEVAVLERRNGTFLCEVRIDTGRPHQIRIHLAAAGYPLAGDPLYAPGGGLISGSRAVPRDTGYVLHATEVSVSHPGDASALTIVSAPPRELTIAT